MCRETVKFCNLACIPLKHSKEQLEVLDTLLLVINGHIES